MLHTDGGPFASVSAVRFWQWMIIIGLKAWAQIYSSDQMIIESAGNTLLQGI